MRDKPVKQAGSAVKMGRIPLNHGEFSTKSGSGWKNVNLVDRRAAPGDPMKTDGLSGLSGCKNPPIPSNFPGEKSAAAENGARHRNAEHGTGRGAAIRIFRRHSVNLISHRRKRGFFPEMGKASIPKSAATAAAGVRPARGFDERL